MIISGDVAVGRIGIVLNIPSQLSKEKWLVNLEGSLVKNGSDYLSRSGVYNDLDAIKAIKNEICLYAISLANNHVIDVENISTTQANARMLNLLTVGAGKDINYSRREIEIDGFTIISFGWECIECVQAGLFNQGVNPYNKENVFRTVKELLDNGKRVVCFFHWNYELEKYPQPYDRKLAHELIDMGVEAVIGCHAHRVQPIEFYKGKPIVYGLGNFIFCQGHYFDGKLKFPKFCEEEYAFEISSDGYKLHYFHYDQQENRLDYVKSSDIRKEKEFDGKAEFTGFSYNEYNEWFKQHRVQKKLLPIFYANESTLSYWTKSEWIKIRGGLINLLANMHLKSRNRANK